MRHRALQVVHSMPQRSDGPGVHRHRWCRGGHTQHDLNQLQYRPSGRVRVRSRRPKAVRDERLRHMEGVGQPKRLLLLRTWQRKVREWPLHRQADLPESAVGRRLYHRQCCRPCAWHGKHNVPFRQRRRRPTSDCAVTTAGAPDPGQLSPRRGRKLRSTQFSMDEVISPGYA